MFFKKKKEVKQEETTWRFENDIYRKLHELGNLYIKLDELKAKGKQEKNPHLRQLIANEYMFVEQKITTEKLAIDEMQKTLYQNQDYRNKEALLNIYKELDQKKESNVKDLKRIVAKIKDVQETRLNEDKEREEINSIFNDGVNTYNEALGNDRAKSIAEMWAEESEAEDLLKENEEENLEKTLEESKGDL